MLSLLNVRCASINDGWEIVDPDITNIYNILVNQQITNDEGDMIHIYTDIPPNKTIEDIFKSMSIGESRLNFRVWYSYYKHISHRKLGISRPNITRNRYPSLRYGWLRYSENELVLEHEDKSTCVIWIFR